MDLEFFGKDPNSEHGECPSVWVDKDTGDLVFQGWDAPEDMLAACRLDGAVPEGESVVRLPARMAAVIREAIDAAERSVVR